jgi:hypothetical protein
VNRIGLWRRALEGRRNPAAATSFRLKPEVTHEAHDPEVDEPEDPDVEEPGDELVVFVLVEDDEVDVDVLSEVDGFSEEEAGLAPSPLAPSPLAPSPVGFLA